MKIITLAKTQRRKGEFLAGFAPSPTGIVGEGRKQDAKALREGIQIYTFSLSQPEN